MTAGTRCKFWQLEQGAKYDRWNKILLTEMEQDVNITDERE